VFQTEPSKISTELDHPILNSVPSDFLPPPSFFYFQTNASIVRDLAKVAAKACPKAHMLIISNPVNSTVPIVAEVFKKAGVYDPKK